MPTIAQGKQRDYQPTNDGHLITDDRFASASASTSADRLGSRFSPICSTTRTATPQLLRGKPTGGAAWLKLLLPNSPQVSLVETARRRSRSSAICETDCGPCHEGASIVASRPHSPVLSLSKVSAMEQLIFDGRIDGMLLRRVSWNLTYKRLEPCNMVTGYLSSLHYTRPA